MVLSIIYWAVWQVILPKMFGYELVLNKAVLDDGMVVVARFIILLDIWLIIFWFFFLFFFKKIYSLDELKK